MTIARQVGGVYNCQMLARVESTMLLVATIVLILHLRPLLIKNRILLKLLHLLVLSIVIHPTRIDIARMEVYSILNLPPRISSCNLIGGGTSGVATLILGITIVLKFPYSDEDECKRCDREVEVYKYIKSSLNHYLTSLLYYRGKNEYSILLEYTNYRPI
jgi:hypothetical protein